MEHEHTPSALPLDSLSPLQLRAHAELRSDVATLMAPYMFDGIEAASMLAGHLGAESPKERYDAVLATTLALLDMPESREAYAMRYPEFQDRIPVTKQFSRIYDFHFPILIEAAIIDAGWVGLGAARFLESSGRIDEASAIIPRSFGLLSIAKANKDCVLGLRNELGNPIDRANLKFVTPAAAAIGDTIAFTDDAEAIIASHPSRMHGCAAYALDTFDDKSGDRNLLHEYWRELSEFTFSA